MRRDDPTTPALAAPLLATLAVVALLCGCAFEPAPSVLRPAPAEGTTDEAAPGPRPVDRIRQFAERRTDHGPRRRRRHATGRAGACRPATSARRTARHLGPVRRGPPAHAAP
ncbi:MAG: hypothetical protein AB7L84_15845 [Acidimicrobiia bacterium]